MPKDKNTRPLKDMVRESIFNLLNHSNEIKLKIKDSNVLDLYAGTGSFGLECLSREARFVFFVENKKLAIEVLKKNIEKLNVNKKTKIFPKNIFSLFSNKENLKLKFDLIFCDPPFKDNNINEVIKLIFSKDLVNKNTIIILHRERKNIEKFPEIFHIIEERIYGNSKIIFGKF
tara:strand:- start:2650 stop:3171 length:522 start_codon:yes stop_codon:yes gene_type:complete